MFWVYPCGGLVKLFRKARIRKTKRVTSEAKKVIPGQIFRNPQ